MNFPGGGYSATGKVTKYQDLPKYEFSKVRGGGNLQLKSQSAKISDNFQGGGILKLTWYSVWVQSMCYIFYFIFKYYSLFH